MTGAAERGSRVVPSREALLKYRLLSAVSGVLWALLAMGLLPLEGADRVWSTLPAGAVIGLGIGHISLSWVWKRWFVRAALSLMSLCLGVAAYGVALVLLQGGLSNPEHVLMAVIMMLAGMALTGAVVFLWPLAWLNHEALWSLSGIRDREPPGAAALNLSSDS